MAPSAPASVRAAAMALWVSSGVTADDQVFDGPGAALIHALAMAASSAKHPRGGGDTLGGREGQGQGERVDQGDGRPIARGLADAVGQQRLLRADVAADEQAGAHGLQPGDGQAQPGQRGIQGVGAGVALAQAVIDVGAAQAPHQLLGEVQLLQGRTGGNQTAQSRTVSPGGSLEALGGLVQGVLPGRLMPGPVALDHGCNRRSSLASPW